jgi:hypothetical protein
MAPVRPSVSAENDNRDLAVMVLGGQVQAELGAAEIRATPGAVAGACPVQPADRASGQGELDPEAAPADRKKLLVSVMALISSRSPNRPALPRRRANSAAGLVVAG